MLTFMVKSNFVTNTFRKIKKNTINSVVTRDFHVAVNKLVYQTSMNLRDTSTGCTAAATISRRGSKKYVIINY